MKANFKQTAGPYIALEDGSGNILLESGGFLLREKNPLDETVGASYKPSFTATTSFDGPATIKAVYNDSGTTQVRFNTEMTGKATYA